MRTINPLFETPRKDRAEFEMVGDANDSNRSRFATARGIVITFFHQFGATLAVEKWEFENFGFDSHSSIEIRRAQRENLEGICNDRRGVQCPITLQPLEHRSSHQVGIRTFEVANGLSDIPIRELYEFVTIYQQNPLPGVASEQSI